MTSIEPSSIDPLPLIQTAGFNLYTGIEFALLALLLIGSALISGSEAAYFSLKPQDKEELQNNQEKKAQIIGDLLATPQELLATILVANNFINVAIVILSNAIMATLLHGAAISEGLQLLFEVVLITLVLLLFGEVIPKIYATKNALKFALMMSKPLDILRRTPPMSWIKSILVNGTDLIQKRAKKKGIKISSDELEKALALTKEEDTTENEHRILEGIVKFGHTETCQIMRSRMDVVAIDVASDYQQILQVILESGYSRIPIYKDSFDNVIGILCIKDLLGNIHSKDSEFDWREKIRKPFFVPENKKIDDLLKEFQVMKVHMAVVVDEYGGASGVCTLEDILEEIVGDITDEFDDDELVYTQIDPLNYLFEGKTALVDVYKVLDTDGKAFDEIRGDADTLGGFVVENAGRILRNNEFVAFDQYKLTVESSDKKRVKMVKVTIKEKNSDESIEE